MSVERSARERMGVGTAKQSGVKNKEGIRKPIVAYFVTERERRCENVMEKEDGAQGNYEPRKDFSAKKDNNTRMIERELRKERRSSKDKTRSD